MKNPKMLRNGELIELLQKLDPDLPVVVTRDGKACEYGISEEYVGIIDGAYFGNYDAGEEFEEDQEFVRIALV